MNLYHYFDKSTGPFRSLSDVSDCEAERLLATIATDRPACFCAKRSPDYMQLRRYYETILKEEFLKKGGILQRTAPHYMVVESCPWLETWYENPDCICIPISHFDLRTVSFTYGDSHPTFSDRVNDGKEYRKQLYTYDEILKIIDKYGLPQNWNADGQHGPERYIEAQIWCDEPLMPYMTSRF
jgi:hypothetical protein